MTIKLKSLKLRNFRKWRELELTPNGANMSLHAKNAAGKTSIADAEMWLRTGKSSTGKSDKGFDIKTIGKDGEPFHGLDHEVEGLYDMDGEEVLLRRVYKEVWKANRGENTFAGHTTDFYVDGKSKSEGDYLAAVAAIMPAKYGQLLTNVEYFCSLKPVEQRNILIDAFGNVSDEEVIASDSELKPLAKLIGKKMTVAELHEEAKRLLKQVNDDLKSNPTRIDEASRSLRDVEDKNWPKIVADWQTSLAALQDRRDRIPAGGASAELGVTVTKLEGELAAEENRIRSAWRVIKQAATTANDDRDQKSRRAALAVNDATDRLRRQNEIVTELREKLDKLSAEWKTIRAEKFDGATEIDPKKNVCLTCGRDLPEEQVAENARKFVADRAASLATFNQSKAERLEKNLETGKGLSARLKVAETAVDDIGQELDEARVIHQDINQEDPLPVPPEPVLSEDAKYAAVFANLQEARRQHAESKTDNSGAFTLIDEQIAKANISLKEAQTAVLDQEHNAKVNARIAELEAERSRLGAQVGEHKEKLFLCERFLQKKAEMLTSRINSAFSITTFRLFKTLINGEIQDDCVATIDGRPYDTALSNSERINVGLDIIEGLSKHFGYHAPIFIDNCESVTHPMVTTSQQIRLFVSEDKTLRIEIDGATEPQGTLIS